MSRSSNFHNVNTTVTTQRLQLTVTVDCYVIWLFV